MAAPVTLDVSWLPAAQNALAAAQSAQRTTPSCFTANAPIVGTMVPASPAASGASGANVTISIDGIIQMLQPILDGFKNLRAG
jgi:hypothetical protein